MELELGRVNRPDRMKETVDKRSVVGSGGDSPAYAPSHNKLFRLRRRQVQVEHKNHDQVTRQEDLKS